LNLIRIEAASNLRRILEAWHEHCD
jgi:hypothetical protein